jgi:nitrogen regulatory protein P-II 1
MSGALAVKLVTAILRPHRVADVRVALTTFGIHGMTISQATGYGMELWRTSSYRGQRFHDEAVSNVRMEIVVDDVDAEDVINVILRSAASTASGAGKIWVMPVDALTRVRTGERGADAL